MNTNKNSYTIIYAAVLVIVVAAVLAFVSQSLKDKQQLNIDGEKQLSILSSVGLAQESGSAPNKLAYIKGEFNKYITDSYIVNYNGDRVEGDAFTVDLKTQYDLMKKIASTGADADLQKLQLPVFICTMPDGKVVKILSCYGAGLWGAIWGYLAVSDDNNTLSGAIFDHKSETPGLGAEIATPKFSGQFVGKQIFENGEFTSVNIVKGGATPGNMHEVDAISGGTITSKSLDATIRMWLGHYTPYLMKSNVPVVANDLADENTEEVVELEENSTK